MEIAHAEKQQNKSDRCADFDAELTDDAWRKTGFVTLIMIAKTVRMKKIAVSKINFYLSCLLFEYALCKAIDIYFTIYEGSTKYKHAHIKGIMSK